MLVGTQCSVTCGRGLQTRRVYCLERRSAEWVELDDVECSDATGDVRPAQQQECTAAEDCSTVWLTGPFSQVLHHIHACVQTVRINVKMSTR